MSKTLNEAAMQSELSGSAFFHAPAQVTTPAGSELRPVVDTPVRGNGNTVARANAPTPVTPNARIPERRQLTRCSFELYQDQIERLRRESLQQKLRGEPGSMSEMVRDALDSYMAGREET